VISHPYAFCNKRDGITDTTKEDIMDYKDNRDILRKAGFSEDEMKRLSNLRRVYAAEGKLQEFADYHRLQFVRWLVTTGRLTDQVA
jgi:hypothetical protein